MSDDLKKIQSDMARAINRLSKLDTPLNREDAYLAIKENRGLAVSNISERARQGDVQGALNGIVFLRESYKLISTILGSRAFAAHRTLDEQLDKAQLRMKVQGADNSNAHVSAVTGLIADALQAYSAAVGT